VLEQIAADLRAAGVEIRCGAEVGAVRPQQRQLTAGGETITYGTLVNCAGLHADAVARAFDVGRKYTILPFKGIYYRLSEASGLRINGLIYPVPDLRVPFLGVHFTTKVDGSVYLGPTAVPAFGRENYSGLRGLSLTDTRQILWRLAQQYVVNHQGFRTLVHEEGVRYLKGPFAAAARALVPRLQTRHLLASDKVGIRAQLLDIERKELVMDFVVEQGEHSVHILNAISPAFTSAFSFARLVVDQFENVGV
jgi:L-2-hydroxyglutarate oxidase LhgO